MLSKKIYLKNMIISNQNFTFFVRCNIFIINNENCWKLLQNLNVFIKKMYEVNKFPFNLHPFRNVPDQRYNLGLCNPASFLIQPAFFCIDINPAKYRPYGFF